MTPIKIYPGIYRLTLPLPGDKPGPVNVFVFKGRHHITLLDSGTVFSTRHLKTGLARLGLELKDVDRVILTHGHEDHYGGANAILSQTLNRAKIYAHREDTASIEKGGESSCAAYHRFLRYAGSPAGIRFAISTLFLCMHLCVTGCRVNQELTHGAKLSLGDYEARIIATPGHTRGSVCFYLEKEGLLFSGDHILAHITPNALVMLEESLSLPRRLSQREYFNSLDTIAGIKPKIIHPAHGREIDDFGLIYHTYRKNFQMRQKSILDLITSTPGKSVFAMAGEIFPQLKGKPFFLDLFLATSEIYTHIQVLEADGYVNTKIRNNLFYVERR